MVSITNTMCGAHPRTGGRPMLDAMSFVALLRPALRPVPSIFASIVHVAGRNSFQGSL